MAVIDVRNLVRSFGDKVVLNDISLEVGEGEILAIMGSSGGGKTTLLRCISGLIEPTSGSVQVDGVNVVEEPEEARRRMGMVFQQAALFDFMNVEDNVLFGVRRWKIVERSEQKDFVHQTLKRLGLEGNESKMPAELSGGMRKRVGIARALALKPKVMLYDEPVTGLDPITAYSIDQLIVDLRSELKVTSLVVSHDVSSVFRVADRIAFLEAGKLTFIGSKSEFEKSRNEAIGELVQKAQARELSA